MSNINLDKTQAEYIREQLEAKSASADLRNTIKPFTNPSKIRSIKYKISKDTELELTRGKFGQSDVDPYDNTPAQSKIPKDKIMGLTNSTYTATLLEKILKNTDSTQFSDATLKFQEQTLNYMQTMSADIKQIADALSPKERRAEERDAKELTLGTSSLAKSLVGLDVETTAKVVGKAIFQKMDSSGMGELVQSMYGQIKDAIEGGEFRTMVRGMIQSSMLKALPAEWQKTIEDLRTDPVMAVQMRLNKLGRSDNTALRDIFGSFVTREKPNLDISEKKIDMSAKALFDNKFYTSVTKIIPEQLYKIVAALEGHEEMVYDWKEQSYLTASEAYARSQRHNFAVSQAGIDKSVMDIFSFQLSQAVTDRKLQNPASVFELDANGAIIKDAVTGHVKLRNKRIKDMLVRLTKSGIDLESFIHASPSVLLSELGVSLNDPVKVGQSLDDIATLQHLLANVGVEDRTDMQDQLSSVRQTLHSFELDNTTNFLSPEKRALYDKIIYSNSLTKKQKQNLIRAINKKGIKVHGVGGVAFGTGLGGSISGSDPLNTFVGDTTTTDTEAIMKVVNTPRNLSGLEADETRYFDELLANRHFTKPSQGVNVNSYSAAKPINLMTSRSGYKNAINSYLSMGAITEAQFKKLDRYSVGGEISNKNESELFKSAGVKVEAAHRLFGILSRAGMTADAKAKLLGISVQEARSRGYVSNAWELIKCLDKNGNVRASELKKYNMQYLDKEELEALEKIGNDRRRSILGSGTINQQISKTLSSIFGDPKIASKAGLTIGGAAGLGIGKLLKDAGIISSPRTMYLLGGVGAALMTLERSKSFMTNVFGPSGDIKGDSGFTNKEIFLAKAMTKYLPAMGVGGKVAKSIMKAMSAFGPLGKGLGLLSGVAVGSTVGFITPKILEGTRNWLFDPDRDKNSKIAKVASFIRGIPGVSKFLALKDTRSDQELVLASVQKLKNNFVARDAADKQKGGPGFTKEIKACDRCIESIETYVRNIKTEESLDNPNEAKIKANTEAIGVALEKLNAAIGTEGSDIRKRYYDTEVESRNEQNRISSAMNQSYSNVGKIQDDRINDLISNYISSDADNAESFRSYISGDESGLSDMITDSELAAELKDIAYRKSLGLDIGDSYTKWKKKFAKANPSQYKSFMELASGGIKGNKAIDSIIDSIEEYLVNERSMTGSRVVIRNEAERLFLEAVNNKKRLGGIIGKDGDVRNVFAKFLGNFNGIDAEDVANERVLRDFIAAEEGGRGTKPVKMAEMKKYKFATGESLDAAGCSIAAITNALVYMGIDSPEPETLIAVANRHLSNNGGVTSDFFAEVCQSLGIRTEIYNGRDNVFTVDTLRSFKIGKDNGLVVLVSNQFSSGYHYITIKSVNGRTVVINDPEKRGTEELPAADIISRLVEIIHMTSTVKATKKVTSSVDPATKPVMGGGIIRTLKERVVNNINEKLGSIARSASGIRDTWVGNKSDSGSIIGALARLLHDTVLNVRVIDDLTLPLKIGDAEAGEAILRTQAQSLAGGNLKQYSQKIKKILHHRDVQKELAEDDLVQNTIINGGLVAGASTGLGGKGSGTTASKYRQNDGILQRIFNSGKKGGEASGEKAGIGSRVLDALGIGGLVSNVTGILPAALTAGAGLVNSVIGSKGFEAAKFKLMTGIDNLFGEPTEEEKQQKFDAEGNQIQKGFFKDVGGSVRNIKDSIKLAKGTIMTMGATGGVFKKALTVGKASKIGIISKAAKVGLGESGMFKWIVKAINAAFIDLPIKLTDWILKNDYIAGFVGGSRTLKDLVSGMVKPLQSFGNKFKDKIATAFAKKAGPKLAASTASKAKGFFRKLPGLGVMISLGQLPFSAYTGWKHAHQYIGVKPENISMATKFKVSVAKILYDIGPDLLISIACVGMPVLGAVLDVFTAVFRLIVTFDDILVTFGLKEDKAKDEAELKAGEDAAEKNDKEASGGTDGDKLVAAGSAATGGSGAASSSLSKIQDSLSDGVSFTAHHEGFRSKMYYDTEGKRTIGHGFNLDSGRFTEEQVNRWITHGITEEESRKILAEELAKSRADMEKYPWFKKLDPVRQGAIVDLAYNMGSGWVQNFPKAIKAIEAGDFQTAAAEILDSRYARQTGIRARRIAQAIANGADTPKGEPKPITGGKLGLPVKGHAVVTSAFGPRNISYGSRNHAGIDLRARGQAEILAAADGKVISVDTNHNAITIQHPDGTTTKYLHNSSVMVRPGDEVKKGQVIALSGNVGRGGVPSSKMGEHLHFEVLKAGKHVDPFIELGLNKANLKLDSSSPENYEYLKNNSWLSQTAKSQVKQASGMDTANAKTTSKEAGGPSYSSYTEGSSSSKNVTIVNRDSGLEAYVKNLDAKFDQMISLLSKLVENSKDSTNKILSEAISPARV